MFSIWFDISSGACLILIIFNEFKLKKYIIRVTLPSLFHHCSCNAWQGFFPACIDVFLKLHILEAFLIFSFFFFLSDFIFSFICFSFADSSKNITFYLVSLSHFLSDFRFLFPYCLYFNLYFFHFLSLLQSSKFTFHSFPYTVQRCIFCYFLFRQHI